MIDLSRIKDPEVVQALKDLCDIMQKSHEEIYMPTVRHAIYLHKVIAGMLKLSPALAKEVEYDSFEAYKTFDELRKQWNKFEDQKIL